MPEDTEKSGDEKKRFPFTVKAKGGKFVIQDANGKEVGAADDEDKAKEMAKKMAAKMAESDGDEKKDMADSEDKEDGKGGKPFSDLRGVEVMRVGKWNGVPITERDLRDMVESFGKVGFEPALKLDRGGDRKTHQDGGPAYGYVSGLSLSGDRLVADFKDVPGALIEAIRDKRYNRVSAEIFQDFERDGKAFRRVLKAVELMGATVPAVADLKPVSDSLGFSFDFANHDYLTVTVDFSEEEEDMGLQAELKAAREEIARLKSAAAPANFADSDEYRRMSQRIHDMEEKERQAEISRVVSLCKLPAIRGEISVFADWATQRDESESINFSDGSRSPLQAVETLVSKINGIVSKHFDEAAVSRLTRDEDAPPTTPEEAADRMAELQRKYAVDHPDSTEEQFQAFMAEKHPEVLEMYAQG